MRPSMLSPRGKPVDEIIHKFWKINNGYNRESEVEKEEKEIRKIWKKSLWDEDGCIRIW